MLLPILYLCILYDLLIIPVKSLPVLFVSTKSGLNLKLSCCWAILQCGVICGFLILTVKHRLACTHFVKFRSFYRYSFINLSYNKKSVSRSDQFHVQISKVYMNLYIIFCSKIITCLLQYVRHPIYHYFQN